MRKFTITWFSLLIITLLSCGEVNETERVAIEVTIDPEGAGSVLTSGGDEIGSTAEFLAVENSGWTFAGWSGDVDSFENPLRVELVDDVRIVGSFSLFTNNYRVNLSLSDLSSSVDLAFGQTPGATDGFDSGLDAEAPPSPPDALHGWFEIDNLQLFEDFRNAFSSEVTWNLKILNGDSGPATLSWTFDIEEFNGTLTLGSPQGEFSVDMTERNSFEFNPGEIDQFTITFRL